MAYGAAERLCGGGIAVACATASRAASLAQSAAWRRRLKRSVRRLPSRGARRASRRRGSGETSRVLRFNNGAGGGGIATRLPRGAAGVAVRRRHRITLACAASRHLRHQAAQRGGKAWTTAAAARGVSVARIGGAVARRRGWRHQAASNAVARWRRVAASLDASLGCGAGAGSIMAASSRLRGWLRTSAALSSDDAARLWRGCACRISVRGGGEIGLRIVSACASAAADRGGWQNQRRLRQNGVT